MTRINCMLILDEQVFVLFSRTGLFACICTCNLLINMCFVSLPLDVLDLLRSLIEIFLAHIPLF